MTQEKLIEELLTEASALGIRREVIRESHKYEIQGMPLLEALEAAFAELTEGMADDDDEVDELTMWESLDLETWPDDSEE